jgi:hypothetical protein
VRPLPLADPGLPDLRSASRFLVRIAWLQRWTVLGGMVFGILLLDPRAARHLERSLAAVVEGRTVVAIAHRLHTASDADRVAVVEDGRVTEPGSHDELLALGGSSAALWRSWQSA